MRKYVVNPKDLILEMEKTIIWYKYKCQDCDHVYVRETERTIQVRAKEDYRNFMDKHNRIDWNPTRIGSEQQWYHWLVKEKLHIQ